MLNFIQANAYVLKIFHVLFKFNNLAVHRNKQNKKYWSFCFATDVSFNAFVVVVEKPAFVYLMVKGISHALVCVFVLANFIGGGGKFTAAC